MKSRSSHGRPLYRIQKLQMLRKREDANLNQEPHWRSSHSRAGISLLDLELFTFEVEKRVTWAETALDREPEEDEPQSDSRRHHGQQQMRIEGDVEFRWRER